MGYESRVYAMTRHEYKGFVFGCEVARFEVFAWPYSGVNDEWLELFTEPIDYDLPEDSDDGARADCYGKHCKAADAKTVFRWLRAFLDKPENDGNARAHAFLGWLDAIHCTEWGKSLQLVEWGH